MSINVQNISLYTWYQRHAMTDTSKNSKNHKKVISQVIAMKDRCGRVQRNVDIVGTRAVYTS